MNKGKPILLLTLAITSHMLWAEGARQIPMQESIEPMEDTSEGMEQTSWRDDFSFSIGTKVWINRWDSTLFERERSVGGIGTVSDFRILGSNSNSFQLGKAEDTDEQITPIPIGTIRYKNFFITGGYYVETDFSFNKMDSSDNQTQFSNEIGVNIISPEGLSNRLKFFGLPDTVVQGLPIEELNETVTQTGLTSVEVKRDEWDLSLAWAITAFS